MYLKEKDLNATPNRPANSPTCSLAVDLHMYPVTADSAHMTLEGEGLELCRLYWLVISIHRLHHSRLGRESTVRCLYHPELTNWVKRVEEAIQGEQVRVAVTAAYNPQINIDQIMSASNTITILHNNPISRNNNRIICYITTKAVFE